MRQGKQTLQNIRQVSQCDTIMVMPVVVCPSFSYSLDVFCPSMPKDPVTRYRFRGSMSRSLATYEIKKWGSL